MQRPILLQGHSRPLTMVKYNREGDLIFTTAKDKVASVWYSHNGERVGTYKGHNGSLWGSDVDCTKCSAQSVCRLAANKLFFFFSFHRHHDQAHHGLSRQQRQAVGRRARHRALHLQPPDVGALGRLCHG